METNRRICSLLKENAKLTPTDIARLLGITEADAEAAVRRLEQKGIIRGYSAVINEERLGSDYVSAFIEVKVTPKADDGFDEVARTIMMYDEVESLALMSGAFDLAVTVSGTDYKDIALFVAKRLSTINGVISTSTHFFLKPYKEKNFFLEEEQKDERGFFAP
ncbi:MAG: Lrp/AsnC family transcriptional regulator [Ruminococcus sp.]|jgi:DNA-binding Lrp family transcriptional regulator|nr:Lrp/AsnC family transcriptional regulator [Ruminococcus sp.]